MQIQFSTIQAAYDRMFAREGVTPFSQRQLEKYGLLSVARTAIPDIGSIRTCFRDDVLDAIVAGHDPEEPIEIIEDHQHVSVHDAVNCDVCNPNRLSLREYRAQLES